MDKHILALAGTAVLSLATGGYIGYSVAKKQLTTVYEAQLAEETANARAYYSRLHKTDEYSTPAAAARKLRAEADLQITPEEASVATEAVKALSRYRGDDVETVSVAVARTEESLEVFAQRGETDTNEGEPYLISQTEFLACESGYLQATLTYYDADDVLLDEDESRIDDVDAKVGARNLTRFGELSSDSNAVYIRNDKLEMEYEVLRLSGSYAVIVLGVDSEPEKDEDE